MKDETILIQGGGDLASGVAYKLFRSGMRVVILEIPQPLAVRRTVSFAQAVWDNETQIEGVCAVFARDVADIEPLISARKIPVSVAPFPDMLNRLKPHTLINATLAKRNNTGMHRNMAPLTIALGPGFLAGRDAHVVIETQRGHDLGKLIYAGPAAPNTGIPGTIMGHGAQRVLRAPCDGFIRHVHDIGARVKRDEIICTVDDRAVTAPFDGMVRGLIMDRRRVTRGLKIGDVDPRGRSEYCHTFSDKARAIGGAVLEAILHERAKRS